MRQAFQQGSAAFEQLYIVGPDRAYFALVENQKNAKGKSGDNSKVGQAPEPSGIEDVAVTLALSNSALRALSFLGTRKVVESVLDILELEHSVSINDVARRPDVFLKGIESMFGAGSDVITRLLCTEIAKDLGVPREGKTLPELVKLAHERINSSEIIEETQKHELVTSG